MDKADQHFEASDLVDWLTSRTFTFRADPRGQVLSDTFHFHRNGFVLGYRHPNECCWQINEDGQVEIVDQHGRPTCRMTVVGEGEQRQLSGFFLSPWAGYEPTSTLHVLIANDSDFHCRIQSFDLFDTLVARRCFQPLEVFRRVEARAGVSGFATRRHLVEMGMFGRQTYGLDDIYRLLVAEGTLTPHKAEAVRQMELEEEWEMLFPIAHVVSLVNPDDIIISDMYLPRAFVERVIREKCGLTNRLFLSNYGKHHREIWPSITAQYKLREHFGDNQHADVNGPASLGIAASLVTISKWDQSEEILHAGGLGAYAFAVREARLSAFHPMSQIRHALHAQVSLNIPLLIVGAQWLRLMARDFGADRLLTAARDCNLWHHLLASPHFARAGLPPATYLQISRTLCHSGSALFEAYFRSKLGVRTLLVDVVGTGKSFQQLITSLSLSASVRPCILVADEVSNSPVSATVSALLHKEFYAYRLYMEGLNASLDGSAVEAVLDDHLIRIETQANEFDREMQGLIAAMRKAFFAFLPLIERFEAPAIDMLDLAGLTHTANALIEQFPAHHLRLAPIGQAQQANMRRGIAPSQAAVA